MNFYEPINTAQHIVALSLRNPNVPWALLAVNMGGLIHGDTGHIYLFPDGSMLTFTESRLPVEYVEA